MKRWIQKALGIKRRRAGLGPHHRKAVRKVAAHRGALHRQLGIPAGKKIPLKKLRWAAQRPGKLGRRARFALTARGFKHKYAQRAR